MGDSAQPRPGAPPRTTLSNHRLWLQLLLVLLVWQGWLTLSLFGGARAWKNLLDDRPILSGRHPLHLYHGYLGARALREHGSMSCYDPTFHAGYPKTPVFDSGSRPAELLLAVAGGRFRPAAYKIGLALMCAVVPLLLFVAARSLGLNRAAAWLACLMGLLVWWGQPCREMLESGDIDLLLATLLVLAQAGFLIRYHHDPGPLSWLGVVGTSLLGWFVHPVLLALMLPLFLVYYLSIGTRHRITWHLALLGGLLAALVVNCFWLFDWIGYWWLRVPRPAGGTGGSPVGVLGGTGWRSVWESAFWGGAIDKAFTCILVAGAALGVVLYNQNGRRATARLVGLAWAGFLALSVAGLMWEPLGRLGAPRLRVPALMFAVLPAAHALDVAAASFLQTRRRGDKETRRSVRLFVSLSPCLLVLVGAAFLWRTPPSALATWVMRLVSAGPLKFGLDVPQQAILKALREHTTSAARILWEDRAAPPLAPHWTPLLSLLTDRAYIGGLDPEAGIEHTTNGLIDAVLMGRPIRDWTDDGLDEYCKRYNIGWVACWSPATYERLHDWPRAQLLTSLPSAGTDAAPGYLFGVRRPSYSFALSGSLRWLAADPQRIILGDVIPPQNGSDNHGKKPVLLSLHYQAGMRVVPSRVHLDACPMEPDHSVPGDSRPFVRLWIDEPVTRVTITWDKR